MADTPQIRYTQGDQTLLNEAKTLWEALNQHHMDRSAHFKQHYREMTFEKRKAVLLKKSKNSKMHVALAIDEVTGQKVGYIVSSIDEEKIGEIESVIVDLTYRGNGVGGTLMRDTLAWMDANGAVEKIVEVSVGNEKAFGFYSKFGFCPRKTILKQVKEK